MWRACGTYVWSRFRRNPRFCAYYEPCHERLATYTPTKVDRSVVDEFRKAMRHPPGDTPYLLEFPLGPAGRVDSFLPRFCYENYYMSADATDRPLAKYISGLIQHAHVRRQIPVAKCCRWSLRTSWLRQAFDAITFYVVRDPDALFRSYWSFGGPTSYFFAAMVLIVSKNRRTAVFEDTAGALSVPPIQGDTIAQELAQAAIVAARLDPQALRDLVLLLWALALKHNATYSQLLVDVDCLATQAEYRLETEQRIATLVGQTISFDDIRQPHSAPAPGAIVSNGGRERARRALHALTPQCDWSRVTLSLESARALDTVLS